MEHAHAVALLIAKSIIEALRQGILPFVYAEGLDWGLWGWIASIASLMLTASWVTLWQPRGKDLAKAVEDTIGPAALIAWVATVGLLLASLVFIIFWGVLAPSYATHLGPVLRLFPSYGVGVAALGLLLVGPIFFYYLGRLITSVFKGFMQIDEPGEKKSKMDCRIAGIMAIVVLVNHPVWNQPLYWIFSIVSALLGIYVLTRKGVKSCRT